MKKKTYEKRVINQLIRMRITFAEYVVKDKYNKFSSFSHAEMKDVLKKLKKKYPYCYRTRYKKWTEK